MDADVVFSSSSFVYVVLSRVARLVKFGSRSPLFQQLFKVNLSSCPLGSGDYGAIQKKDNEVLVARDASPVVWLGSGLPCMDADVPFDQPTISHYGSFVRIFRCFLIFLLAI